MPSDPNTNNPLRLRWLDVGLPRTTDFGQLDQNFLNLVRDAGVWSDRNYKKNERVFFEGASYIAETDITAGSDPYDSPNWRLEYQPGGGGMFMSSPTAGPTIGAGWTTVDVFDTIDFGPFGCTLDTTNNTFGFTFRGAWFVSLLLSFTQVESNQGRETALRLFDVTAGSPSDSLTIPIARNQPGTLVYFQFPVEITTAIVGNQYRWELGGGDSVNIIDYETVAMDIIQAVGGKAP